jgi:peptidoglycan/LPS O-acetylase OafA/YrhL
VSGLAGCSYGVFLVHQTLGDVLMLRLQQDLGAGPTVQTLAMVVTGIVVGVLLTCWIERPAHRALLCWWDRRHEPLPVHRLTVPARIPVGAAA